MHKLRTSAFACSKCRNSSAGFEFRPCDVHLFLRCLANEEERPRRAAGLERRPGATLATTNTFCLTSAIAYARLHSEVAMVCAAMAEINHQSRNVLPDQQPTFSLCRASPKTTGGRTDRTGGGKS